jgi:hypothetical protein
MSTLMLVKRLNFCWREVFSHFFVSRQTAQNVALGGGVRGLEDTGLGKKGGGKY